MKKALSVFLAALMLIGVFGCMTAFAENSYCDTYGHRYGDWQILSKATCIGKGTQKRICEFCNDIQIITTPVDPNNHAKLSPGVANNDGTHTLTCADCSTELVRDCVYSVTSNGDSTHTKVCYYCNYTVVDDCALTVVADQATQGQHVMRCETCGYNYHVDCDYSEAVAVPAKCTSAGYNGVKCACGDMLVTELLPILNHVDANGDNKCDTCGKTMVEPEPEKEKSTLDIIKELFQKIIDWFKSIFS